MKCRSMKSLSTSFLYYFLYALCCLSLCLGFGSSSVNASFFNGNFDKIDLGLGGDLSLLSSSKITNGSYDYLIRNTNSSTFGGFGWISSTLYFGGGGTSLDPDQIIKLSFSTTIQTSLLENDVSGPHFNLNLLPYCPSVIGSDGTHFTVESCSIVNNTPLTLGTNNSTQYPSATQTFASYSFFLEIRPVDKGFVSRLELGKLFTLNSSGRSVSFTLATRGFYINYAPNPVVEAIKDSADQAHKDSQAQQDAINNQTKQEQDHYEKDKQEEQDREESAKNDGNGLLGIFNITLLNPFAGIWEMFNSGGCVSIPTIAGWVGSKDTTYCSWWPQSIRATLTPVFSISSMVLLFGFFVRWLGGGDGIDVKGVNL